MISLHESYEACAQISRASGSSFYRSFAFLRPDRRRAMVAFYAFARVLDDIADQSDSDASNRWNLADVETWIDACAIAEGNSTCDIHLDERLDRIASALSDACRRFAIPIDSLKGLARGVDSDIRGTEIRNWYDLHTYCHQVASTVGIACLSIWHPTPDAPKDRQLLDAAVDCGIAFQLTNILRDLVEDAVRNRCYLPTDELALFGIERNRWIAALSEKQVLQSPELRDWEQALMVQIERAEALFENGYFVSEQLAPDGKRMFTLMWNTYRSLLEKIRKQLPLTLEGPVRLTRFEKIGLVAQHVFTPWFDRKHRIMTKKFGSAWARARRVAIDAECKNAAKSEVCVTGMPPKIAVIGGGLAGINAALHLARHGASVHLFEAKSRLGGRVGSYFDANSNSAIDYCQHVGMKCCTELTRWIRTTGQSSEWVEQSTLHFVSKNGNQITAKAMNGPAPLHMLGMLWRWPDLSIVDRLAVGFAMQKLQRSIPDAGFNSQLAIEWLKQSYQRDSAINSFWETILVSALGEKLERLTMGPVRKVLVEGFMARRDAYHLLVPKKPLASLLDEYVVRSLKQVGVNVHLNRPVSRIERDDMAKWTISGTCDSERSFDAIVVAVPWHRIGTILPSDFCVKDRDDNPAKLDSSPITGIHTWWDRPWLPTPHAILIGRLCQWIFPAPEAQQLGTAKNEDPNRAVEPQASQQEHYYQIVISGSRDLPRGAQDQILAEIRRELEELFPEVRKSSLVRAKIVTDPHSVFSVPPNGVEARWRSDLFGAEKLFVAGDWTGTDWPATMEGALRSGLLAAESVLHSLGRKANLLSDI